MGGYILRRLVLAIPILLIVVVIVFSLVHATPGDPAIVILGPDATPEQIENLRDQLGLNEPILTQFTTWFLDVLRFDLGDSFFLRMPVTQALWERAEVTGLLTLYSLTIAVIVGYGLGILVAVKANTTTDRVAMVLSLSGAAIPNFFLGILLIMLFAVTLRWLPSGGYVSLFDNPFAGIGMNLARSRMPAYLTTSKGTASILACLSTFGKGQEASAQRDNMPGRPGLNPLRFSKIFDVRADQLETLRQIATDLGVEKERLDKVHMGFAFPPDDPAFFPFLGENFREAETPKLHTQPKTNDVEEMERWIAEARNRSDVVIMSVHSHEAGEEKEQPAEFMIEFAHNAINAGADMVVGHGPHLLLGMEMYKGKPVFCSLGNFVGQNELVERLPSDSYTSFRVDSAMTPSAIFESRTENGTKSYPADVKYWQTVLPVCEFEAGSLVSLKLVPVSLGHGERPFERGRPRLADAEESRAIVRTMQKLSHPFGTEIMDDGTVQLAR